MLGIKICGLTNREDLQVAIEAGANAVGFILAPSPRQVSPEKLRELAGTVPPFVTRVGVVTPRSGDNWRALLAEGLIDLVQLHGDVDPTGVPPAKLIKVIKVGKEETVPEAGENSLLINSRFRGILLDTFEPGIEGGTGKTFPWEKARAYRELNLPIILAGGLTPENVRLALDTVRPWGVDVSSGVERYPGRKCPEKIRKFIAAVRKWEQSNLS